MKVFSTFSIRIKLVLIITLISGISSLVGIASIFFINFNDFKDNLLNHAEFTATIVGSYSVPDLLFKDQKAAKETLLNLHAIPNFEIAFLFDEENKLFSEFKPKRRKSIVFDANLLSNFDDIKNSFFSNRTPVFSGFKYDASGFPTKAYVFKTILDNNNQKIGSLYLQLGTDDFFWKIVSDILVFLVILFGTFLISIILSLIFQRVISKPILQLSSFVTKIAKSKDFSQSIEPNNNDEIGTLYRGTNLLLNEIEQNQQKIILAKKGAEEANHAKSKFLTKISHELRTPLNSLLLLARDLTKNKRNHLDEDELESAAIIHKSGETLLKLINSLLYLAKIEAKKEPISDNTLKLNPFLTNLEKIFIPFAKDKNLIFDVEKPKTEVSIITDEDKLQMILNNLLSNAFKFTKKGQVKLSVQVSSDDSNINFTVSDTGIGIPNSKYEALFDEFSQAHQKSSSSYPGTGLGLAITKKLVTLLEGTIHFESTEGTGSLFQVTLPMTKKQRTPMVSNLPNILIVDDKKDNLIALAKTLSEVKCNIIKASSGLEALEATRNNEFALILSDINMPEMDGYELLKLLRNEENKHTPVIFLTAAYTTDEDRLKGYDVGAVDFIIKPLDEFILNQKVSVFLQLYLQGKQLQSEISTRKKLQHIISINTDYPEIIGQSFEMKKLFELINKVTKTDATVLIQGETGTGKELIAKAIHAKSHRSKGPFISFNCAAIPEALIESELFGHEKGSFTGAENKKPGRFELANEGTLFLDEIGELNLDLQVKLLRVLQEKKVDRVGGLEPVSLDVRFVAATNQNLDQQVREKKFRSDLFYRLNQFPVFVPPLRERKGDIELLAKYFLDKYEKEFKKEHLALTNKALLALDCYEWKGNVRELENIISRAVILCESSELTESLLPFNQPNSTILEEALSESLSEESLNKRYAKWVYNKMKFNKRNTANYLGITYKTLEKRLE